MGLGARATAGVGKVRLMLVWVTVLVTLAAGLTGPVVSAAPSREAALGQAILPPDVASLGADTGWWAAVQARIQQDLGLGGTEGLSTTPDWETTGEQVDDLFGISVASAGDVNGDGYADVIVGAPGTYGTGKEGKAYVFFGSATGLETSPGWSQIGENDDDNFGFSVAGAGDVNGDGYADVLVGAFSHATTGRAYLFLGSATGPSLSPLPPFDGEVGSDTFGYAVAGAGDVNGDGYADILVSDRDFDSAMGRVYVFHGGADGPDTTADRILNGEGVLEWFGHTVAGAGDVNGDGFADIIVGAVGYDEGALTQSGAAYVFHGSAAGVSPTWDWKKAGETRDDWFGCSVAGAGDVNGDGYADVIIGAKYFGGDNPDDVHWGAAYLYHGSATGLADSWDWREIGENDADRFGDSVAGAGDVNGDGYADVVVGASEYSTNQGRAYVYRGGLDGLASEPAWMDDGELSGDYFGVSVAGAGDVNGDGYADVVAGALGFSNDTGKAYAYHGGGDNPGQDDQWGEEGVNTGDWFGFAVAGAGDVNGDGYSDVIVGAQQFNASQGRVYVYLGGEDGLPSFPDWNVDGENGNDWFGCSVAGAGDVNGDGYADVIVGARGYDDGANNEAGKAYLFYGGATGPGGEPWEIVGEAGNSQFGSRVAGAGDLNGDGYADVLVAAPAYDSYRGRVYVYHGSETGPGTSPDTTYQGATTWEYFGYAVAGAGDTNGDGYADVVIGAYGYPVTDGTPQRQGKVQLYVGTAAGLGSLPVWTGLGENNGDNFGKTVAGAGDVDGDGCGDILVGADGFGGLRGKAYLYQGGCGNGTPIQVWTGLGTQALDAFGNALSGAGDVNGDGFADLVVGAFQSPANGMRGSAHLYNGPLSGISYTADWEQFGENTGDRFGISVAGAGDVNGDGYADLLAGANMYDGSRGKVYAYFGNDGGGRRVLTEQRNSDRVEVQPWGLADTADSFEAWLWASDPAGRGRLKLQAEACPPGASWGDAACTTATSDTWEDLFPPAGPASQRRLRLAVDGLDRSTLYHWRARVLYAPYTVLRAGITPPANPAHGPWRRFQAQALEADLRTLEGYRVHLPLVVRNH